MSVARVGAAVLLSWCSLLAGPTASLASPGAAPHQGEAASDPVIEAGKRMYREGVLPSGELMQGIVQGDIPLTGEQVICGRCHRRSGLGATEGQEVAPPITGDILFAPLRVPTSKPPLAPELRPAYTDETLRRAIRDGIGANGQPINPLMPRYPLRDEQLDVLIAYLKTMSADPHPGVDERDMHLATIVTEGVAPLTREAFLNVFEAFLKQKNTETRHETHRAEHAPWHKAWAMKPYRKWVLHVWELSGPPDAWAEQLRAKYEEQPVFAVVSGLAAGPWRPIHDFCETHQVPCLFPSTDLPVVDEDDFYSVYLTRGMALEADLVAKHLADDGLLSAPLVQIYRSDEPKGLAAAAQLRHQIEQDGGQITDLMLADGSAPGEDLWRSAVEQAAGGTVVLWLGSRDSAGLLETGAGDQLVRIYLSTSLHRAEHAPIPAESRERVYLVHPAELPARIPRLLIRSTGWLKSQGIYVPEAQREQADAFFALKMAGEGIKAMRGFFVREYLIERIEHMADNATYSSIYPMIRLAPGQRFVSKGGYILRPSLQRPGELEGVTPWIVP